MLIKLGIIAGILILGGMVFSNEIDTFFPATSATVTDSIKNDTSNIGSQASDSVETRIGESVNKIVDETTDSVSSAIDKAGDRITNEINNARDSFKKIMPETVSNFDLVESIRNVFAGRSILSLINSSGLNSSWM